MSKVYFTSDLHFGHKRIRDFDKQHWNVRGGEDSESHDEWLIESINQVVKKRDIIWILGDIAMGGPGAKGEGIGWYNLAKVGRLNGTKKAILGNHDDMPIEAYQQYFQVIRGMFRYKQHWLSHCPIHPAELRDKPNIHGHVHHNTIGRTNLWDEFIPDPNYVNVCVENLMLKTGNPIIDFDDIKKGFR